MKDDPLNYEFVSQRDRISIDVSDIREVVENCRSDVAWTELPLSAKLRVLIKERLAQLEAENKQAQEESRS
ncbi:MAG: hypothetical protein F6K47_04310 [Symploca sp. SIO2E6]|nr:hypothetical protein [Symploca sp. SIO2E6]